MTRPYLKHLARVLRTVPEGSEPVPAIPDDFPEPDLTSGGVPPKAAYVYHNADGQRAFVVKRSETSKGKQILPVSVWRSPEGKLEWYMKALPGSRPLYRLADVLENPGKTVLISEGEKCADAAASFTSCASVTWSGGCKVISKTDFSPLAGRSVLILPDLDDAGATAADTLVSVLKEVGAGSVRRLDMRGLAERCGYEAEAGFDIADAIALGLDQASFSSLLQDPAVLASAEEVALPTGESTSTQCKRDRIQQEVMDQFGIDADKIEGPFTLSSLGVIKQDVDRRGNPIDIFAGSPCVVLGRTRTDDTGPGWGFLIALRTPLEKWETVSLPARLLAGDGRELREVLAASGAIVPQDRAGRQAQAEFIGYAMHGPIVHVATRPGWHGGSFALAKTHYGHAGPAFVEAIINRQAEVSLEAEGIIQMMIDSLVEEGDDPQVRRVAAQFGMVAAAASIASDMGILPWQSTAGIKAAATCFQAWKKLRGGGGSHEEMKALKNLKAFFELHGRTRFERICGSDDGQAEDVPSRADGFAVRDRCGYFEEREDQGKGPLYYILPEAFRNEVCGDHNTDLVLRIARKHGALHHDKDGRRWQKNKRLPDFPQGKKVYVLEPDQLP
ncbi:DUF927 domain-containing protein [Tritonibacter mobilis]|uniref:DUF927 domain-containing protein n=1 Tax=Tritonibacter mobilis TaxID=379347 RepID=UPI001C0A2FC2|nr:DUF927 domain-containing protein [Tritonibacter mobilis]MBU3032671.1 DUF927 domain-containing protein [Tritonibacter mobilis]WHQ81869.1 DUF927 domain-containing protein [Tritonibacter mobilis]